MKKFILAAAILLARINAAEAQPELGEAANNPVLAGAIMPLVSCEEGVIRTNLFLPTYDDKRVRPQIIDVCATQIDAAQEACELVTDYNDDDCKTIINNLLSRDYTAIEKELMRENKMK